MKVAFVSDTHFGYQKYEQDALLQGEAAFLDACQKADILLLGGDIFDSRMPKMETLAQVALLLQKCQKILPASPYPKIYGIHGTHEMRSKNSLNPVAMLAKLGLLEDVHNSTRLFEAAGEKIAISGMGGIPDDLVKSALPRLECKPIEGATNFFMFHQTMQEFVPQAKGLASLEDLPKGYDYYLCGHIHSKKEYLGGRLLIPGSTVITQHKDEEQSPKGYFLIDTTAKTREFVQIKTRPFFVSALKFEGASSSQVRAAIEKELSSLMQKKWESTPILKLTLEGSLKTGSGELDLAGFERDGAIVIIDNNLEGNSLLDELNRLKGEQMLRATPLQLGLSLLRENAKKAGMEEKEVMQYFEKYCEGN